MTDNQASTQDALVVEREIAAPASQIFAILAEPKLHAATDATGMVRGSDAPAITAVGDRFPMRMHAEAMGGDYVMDNEVIAFEPDREIAWRPAEQGQDAPGWTWSYELEPLDAARTLVRLRYDWSAVSAEVREKIPFPAISREALEGSLGKLAESVEGSLPGGMQSIVAPGAAAGQATTLAGNVAASDVTSPREFDSSAEGRRR